MLSVTTTLLAYYVETFALVVVVDRQRMIGAAACAELVDSILRG
jgi:hypothetical protein